MQNSKPTIKILPSSAKASFLVDHLPYTSPIPSIVKSPTKSTKKIILKFHNMLSNIGSMDPSTGAL